MAEALHDERTDRPLVLRHAHVLEDALAAEGIALAGLTDAFAVDSDPDDVAFMATLDAILADVRRAPASIDWESRAQASRKTLTRRTQIVHSRYGLTGVRFRADWRAVRDLNRLVVAMLFATEKQASLSSIAAAVGYGSAAALCHAFANAGLPPPGKIRALTLAA